MEVLKKAPHLYRAIFPYQLNSVGAMVWQVNNSALCEKGISTLQFTHDTALKFIHSTELYVVYK
jgi:hypothetical protein